MTGVCSCSVIRDWAMTILDHYVGRVYTSITLQMQVKSPATTKRQVQILRQIVFVELFPDHVLLLYNNRSIFEFFQQLLSAYATVFTAIINRNLEHRSMSSEAPNYVQQRFVVKISGVQRLR